MQFLIPYFLVPLYHVLFTFWLQNSPEWVLPVLAALAVWEDGSYEMLRYEIATEEGEAGWSQFFEHLMERGLNPQTVQLGISDGTLGLPKALQKHLPNAQQQRIRFPFNCGSQHVGRVDHHGWR